jgi:hypothetical protein
LKLPVIKVRQMNCDAFQKKLKGQDGDGRPKRTACQIEALLYGTLYPALTGRKELPKKSQTGEFATPQNPEIPIVRPTWRR